MSASYNILGIGYRPMYPRQEISSVLRFPEYDLVVLKLLILRSSPIGTPAIASNRLHQLTAFFCFCATAKFSKKSSMVAAEASETTARRANPGRSFPFLSVYNDTAHRTVALFSLPHVHVYSL